MKPQPIQHLIAHIGKCASGYMFFHSSATEWGKLAYTARERKEVIIKKPRSSSGITGVYKMRDHYRSNLRVKGELINFSRSATAEEAKAKRDQYIIDNNIVFQRKRK